MIGWASADLTPAEPVQVCGQFHVRISEGVLDPLTATALAVSSGEGGPGVVMVSCDLVAIPGSLLEAVRAGVEARVPGLDPKSVVLNGTHTHTAPEVRTQKDFAKLGGGITSTGLEIDLPAMDPAQYVAWAAERIAGAAEAAWNGRSPGMVGYGLGHAVVGRNRRSAYYGGESRMYGDTSAPNFSHIEGYEDHGVGVLATWDAGGELTGVVVNVACPSQVSEHLFELSADYWHETREELRRRLGAGLFVLPQCSAAGDQSPHIQVGKAAETRMYRLAGRTEREEIGVRIADAVAGVLPLAAKERVGKTVLRHHVETIELSRRKLSEADVREAMVEADGLRPKYEALARDLEAHPEKRSQPRWYVPITQCFRRIRWLEGVANRYEMERREPRMPVELHVVRIGEVAVATNPFEYYLDFGTQIKARSAAVQTLVVQLAGGGTYVPTERAIAGKSYGAIPASTPVGPEGGRELVERTVQVIEALFGDAESVE
jgi:hypothetical protein